LQHVDEHLEVLVLHRHPALAAAGDLAQHAAALIGLRVLAADILQRVHAHRDAFGPRDDAEIERALNDIETSLSVARGPRRARQLKLGADLAAASRDAA
jgi:hypothetical protein